MTRPCLAPSAQSCTIVNTYTASVNACALDPRRVDDKESRRRDEDGMCGSDALIFFASVNYRPSRSVGRIDDTMKSKPPKWDFTRIASRGISKLRSIAAKSLRSTSIGDRDWRLSTGMSKLRSIAGKSLRRTSRHSWRRTVDKHYKASITQLPDSITISQWWHIWRQIP